MNRSLHRTKGFIMKRLFGLLLVLALCNPGALAQNLSITPVRIPDVDGYHTLKCDFHLHTVFSDGDLWPEFRVKEALAEGLDAIAITDHIEYLPKKKYLGTDRNLSVQIARERAEAVGLILIPGAEITRSMPPGHLNAIFIQDANALATDTWRDAVAEARKQGAVIFWNHPGWTGQQPDGVARWYDEHTELLENGTLWGMEVVNHHDYYPQVLAWAHEKGLGIMGNSDSHEPVSFEFNRRGITHRPMTLVFAKERTAESIKEALLAKRTAVYRENEVIGDSVWLKQIFAHAVTVTPGEVATTGRKSVPLTAVNSSDLTLRLQRVSAPGDLVFPEELTIPAGQSTIFGVRPSADSLSVNGSVTVVYRVMNMITAPERKLDVPLTFRVRIEPKK
jgi:histidinol phosphatase-like PHP family hydrolase